MGRYLYLFVVPLLLLGFGCTISQTVEEKTELNDDLMPIIDMHTHIYPTTKEENEEYIDALVETGLENGVSNIVIGLHARHEPERPPTYSSEHDEWVLEAAEKYPNIIIPALNGFDPADGNEAVEYVREQLATGDWKIVGELDLRNKPKKTTTRANTETLMAIYKLAAEYGVPVMFHYDDYGTDRASGHAELADALAQNPNTTFIFAHTCGSNVEELMQTYENLYCEQEFTPIASGIDINRVVLGTDMQVHGGKPQNASDEYGKLISRVRQAISEWSKEDQEKAATTTAVTLLGL